MKTYRYKGMTSSGASVEGVVDAFDQNDAVSKEGKLPCAGVRGACVRRQDE